MIEERLRKLYRRLPIIRELHSIRERLDERHPFEANMPLEASVRRLEAAAVLVALKAVQSSDPRYQDGTRLLASGAQYWSQNYEDGMIAEIFRRVAATTKTVLEIGVGDGSENNTTTLLAQGWRGWWIEGDARCCASIRQRLALMPSIAAQLTLREAFVSPGSIRELIREMGVPNEIDLFSLDIDQDTYHIWAALDDFRPRVVVVEYNGALPPTTVWINPYEPGRVWDLTQAFGASLKAFEILGRKFGYSLVGCDVIGINAFFVRNDLVRDLFAAPFTAENHYEPPRYHLWYRWAHKSSFFGESQNNT